MSIDLDSSEGRKQYLSEKLDDLLEGINDSYGTLLMEELLSRLEVTVKDFNDEMKVLCDQLVTKEKERQQLLEMLKTSDGLPVPVPVQTPTTKKSTQPGETDYFESDGDEEEIPEWEKKLAKLEKK